MSAPDASIVAAPAPAPHALLWFETEKIGSNYSLTQQGRVLRHDSTAAVGDMIVVFSSDAYTTNATQSGDATTFDTTDKGNAMLFTSAPVDNGPFRLERQSDGVMKLSYALDATGKLPIGLKEIAWCFWRRNRFIFYWTLSAIALIIGIVLVIIGEKVLKMKHGHWSVAFIVIGSLLLTAGVGGFIGTSINYAQHKKNAAALTQ
jgi:hypothetical protein